MDPKGFKRMLAVVILVGIAIGLAGGGLYLTGYEIPGIILVIIAVPLLVISFSLSRFTVYLDFYSSVKKAGKN
ncbi:MAG: hypothetical protein IKD00_02885 [Candidatus Methanomethylophilaceae archaeon]|nr:hypothetical protein [Candidatus Methanomethylophilaceae archaeon]